MNDVKVVTAIHDDNDADITKHSSQKIRLEINNGKIDVENGDDEKNNNNNKKNNGDEKNGSLFLPILALLTQQAIYSSWNVFGKRVMEDVPYVTPMALMLVRTAMTACVLLLVGRILEGPVPCPLMAGNSHWNNQTGNQWNNHASPHSIPDSISDSISNSLPDSISNSISDSISEFVVNSAKFDEDSKNKVSSMSKRLVLPPSTTSVLGKADRRRRKRRGRRRSLFDSFPWLWTAQTARRATNSLRLLSMLLFSNNKSHADNKKDGGYNDGIHVVIAGMFGSFLCPLCYTTGLLLTTPQVTSVWEGPMVPVGCFVLAISWGIEKRSRVYPRGQICSLICAAGGSLLVLLGDYIGVGSTNVNGNGISDTGQSSGRYSSSPISFHEFIKGNVILSICVVSLSVMSFSQKKLSRHPPLTITGWMFIFGFLACLCFVISESIFMHYWVNASTHGLTNGVDDDYDDEEGILRIGCTLEQSIHQITKALHSSPTFCYGLVYSCLFVCAICISISSYTSFYLESSVITLFAACQPPMTALLEYAFMGKSIGWKKVLGMVGVFVGMYYFTYIKRVEKVVVMNDHSDDEDLKNPLNDHL